jgi:SnoaL-like domain
VRAAIACFAAVSLVACAGGQGGVVAKPKGPVGPAIDAAEARQGASDLVTEIYETLGRGNKDSLFTLLDDSLMVFGPRRTDMLGTRADALVALGQVVDPKTKKQLAIQSSKLEVITAPGGRSALAIDTASINGHPHTVMAVLTNSNDLWLVEAVAVAQTPTEQQIKAELAKDAVVPPGAAGAKKIDPSARPAVEKFQRGLLDQAAWGAELQGRADAVVIGPMAGEITRGKQDIKAMWKKRVDGKTRAAISGEITAAVTDDGQLAWVSAPLTRVEGEGTQPLPLRAFAVYVNDGGDWKLLALHESVALGEPGSGAPFKRILPPKPVEEKPPEVIAAVQPKSKDRDKGRDKDRDKDRDKGDKVDKSEPAKAKVAKKASPDEETAKPKKIKQDKAKASEAAEEEAPKKKKLAKASEEEAAEAEAPKKKKKKRSVFRDEDAVASEEASKKKSKSKAEAEEDEAPKKKKKLAKASEEEDEAPKKKKRSFLRDDDEGEREESPKKKSKSKAEAEEEAPKKSKAKSKAAEAEAEEEAPKKSKKSKAAEAEAEEEAPKKSKKSKAAEAEAEEEAPKKSKAKSKAAEAEAEAEAPKKKSKAKAAEAEAEEEAPKKSKSKAKAAEAEAEEEAPKKSKSKAKAAEAEAEEEAPKKKPKAEAEGEAPKKKKKPAEADEDEIEIID